MENIKREVCIKQFKKFILNKTKCINNCNEDDIYQHEYQNTCYESCPNKTKPSKNDIFLCELECYENLPYEIISSQQCVDKCNALSLFNHNCKVNFINSEIQDNLLFEIQNEIENNNFLSKILSSNNKALIIEVGNTRYQIIDLDKEKNQKDVKNSSSIYFGDCEDKLRNDFQIPKNISLFVYKIETFIEGYQFPILQYKIYNSNTNTKLDLNKCKDMKVNILIPVDINEKELFKYDPHNSYYNDLCNSRTLKKGIDIIIKDKRTEFINGNLVLCEENCELIGYDEKTKKAICECPIKDDICQISIISFNKKKLYNKFTSIKNIANLNIMKCYKNLLNKDGIKYNSGSYIVLSVMLFHLISAVIFYKKEQFIISNIIKEITLAKKILNSSKTYEIEKDEKIQENIKKLISNKKNYRKKKYKTKIRKKNNKIGKIKNIKRTEKKSTTSIEISKINCPPIKKRKLKKRKRKKTINIVKTSGTNNENKFELSNSLMDKEKKDKNILDLSISKKEKDIKINDKILKLNDYELNTLNYEVALKYDKRSFCEFYLSLSKVNHLFLFTFSRKNDYNSKIIKIFLFFFSFILLFSVNALFFSDSTMHQIYEDQGSYNFLYQIPQILYSSLISNIVNIIIKALSLSEKDIIGIKKEKNISNIDNNSKIMMEKLSNKFKLFFAISFLFLLFFWYYLACFCAVYKNTQIHLIKDTLISFGISLLYPFFIYIIPATFRIISLRNTKKNLQILYTFSRIIQLL